MRKHNLNQNNRKSKPRIGVANSKPSPNVFTPIVGRSSSNSRYWCWGKSNLMPYTLALIAQQSVAHRRVINDKADYISGHGFTCDEKLVGLVELINNANGNRESLKSVLNKVSFDKMLFGNAFVEIVTDAKHSFLSLYHQDASRCRVAKDSSHILLHHNWTAFSENEAKTLPIYPQFEKKEDGTLRSVIHYKDYEPMYTHYGVPSYIAGLNVAAIAVKTDKWNIERLDNSYQLSGVMMLDVNGDSDEEIQQLVKHAEAKFSGKPGQVLFVIKDGEGDDASKFIPISSNNEGDWKDLHDQSISDIVVAHSWFRSLSGLDYSSGFNAERILYEYEVALNTVIIGEQRELLDVLKDVIEQVSHINTESLQIINKPPVTAKPNYMKVWEARKIDGLEYDPSDPEQQMYISQL